MYTLAIHIPTWKRPGVTHIMVQHLRHQRLELDGRGIALWPFVIQSPGDPKPYDWSVPSSEGWGIVACSNARLGRKWNAGWQAVLKATAHKDPGQIGFMQFGSDNLITTHYLEHAVAEMKAGAEVVGIDEAVFYDLASGRCGKVNPGVPFGYGPGRIYSRSIMDHLGWSPYRPNQQMKMERTIDNRLKAYGPKVKVLPASYDDSCLMCLVDIKTKANIWTYDYARAGRMKHGQWTDLEANQVCHWFPCAEWPPRIHDAVLRADS